MCLGQISATDLVRMKSEQYASDELADWREKTLKKVCLTATHTHTHTHTLTLERRHMHAHKYIIYCNTKCLFNSVAKDIYS